MRIPRAVKKTLITVVVMLVIFVIAGVIYVYITGKQQTKPPSKPPAKQQADLGLPKPQTPAANAAEGVAVESFDSPVKAGDNTSISVRTLPASTCKITVSYNGVASQDSGLADKTSDVYGFATWTWTVAPNVPVGTYPVNVTCAYHGRTGVLIQNLQVKNS